MADEAVHIFLHIPKTAGTSLHQILSREYGSRSLWIRGVFTGFDQIQKANALKLADCRLIRGHMYFGLHSCVGRPFSYFTMVRNPVERVISYYNYHQKEAVNSSSRDHWWINLGRNLPPLEQYITDNKLDREIDNGQLRRIAGDLRPVGECDRSMIDVAKQVVDQSFMAVGLTERFDESVALYHLLLGWRKLPLHVDAKRQKDKAPVDSRLRDILSERLALEIEFYEWLEERFQQQMLEFQQEISHRVKRHQAANRLAGPILRRLLPLYRRFRAAARA
jgi:hypothetical protein